MLANNNGNLFTSSNVDGSTTGKHTRKRKYATDITRSKYKRFADMPLTVAQRQQYSVMQKKAVTAAAETKFIDNAVNASTTSYTWSIGDITDPGSGSTDLTRTGSEITVRDVELRYGVYFNPNATAGTAAVRMVIVQSYEDNSASGFSPSRFFYSTGSVYSFQSPYNHDNRRLFKILYDDVIAISTSGPARVERVVLVKPARKKVRFQNTTSSGDGHIHVCFVANVNSTPGPLVDYYSRVNYTDS